jgi:GrpB-like predicted nucleotidyltransferase (UPF0157 family)
VPAQIRERLWPFLEDERPASRVVRPRQQILADLLRSHPSIELNLEELKRRASKEPWQDHMRSHRTPSPDTNSERRRHPRDADAASR